MGERQECVRERIQMRETETEIGEKEKTTDRERKRDKSGR